MAAAVLEVPASCQGPESSLVTVKVWADNLPGGSKVQVGPTDWERLGETELDLTLWGMLKDVTNHMCWLLYKGQG